MSFAENLTDLRRQRGWSQEELGGRIGVTRQTVSKWEMGQSTPELEKLVELGRVFGLSLDELVGAAPTGEGAYPFRTPPRESGVRSCGAFYEYVSPVKVFGLPLVHINYGLGPRLAKGVIAVGNLAVGGVAIGSGSLGLISLGGISAGALLSLGGVSLGLAAVGGVAIGGFALGGFAAGQWLALGGGAFSNYLAIGGGAWSSGLAIGGSAYGHIAVGNEAAGTFAFLRELGHSVDEIWTLVKREFPHMWSWVREVIQWGLG